VTGSGRDGVTALGTDREDGVTWLPERVRAGVPDADLPHLSYVVVEELVDGVANLMAWAWPRVDRKGRLFWTPSEQAQPVQISAPLGALVRQLYDAARLERRPRCGDTFAARVSPPDGDDLVEDLRDVFPEGVYDLSAEAHQAAKLSYQGALAQLREEPYEQDQAVLFDVEEMPLPRVELLPPEPPDPPPRPEPPRERA
jgi:hypothetical protein